MRIKIILIPWNQVLREDDLIALNEDASVVVPKDEIAVLDGSDERCAVLLIQAPMFASPLSHDEIARRLGEADSDFFEGDDSGTLRMRASAALGLFRTDEGGCQIDRNGLADYGSSERVSMRHVISTLPVEEIEQRIRQIEAPGREHDFVILDKNGRFRARRDQILSVVPAGAARDCVEVRFKDKGFQVLEASLDELAERLGTDFIRLSRATERPRQNMGMLLRPSLVRLIVAESDMTRLTYMDGPSLLIAEDAKTIMRRMCETGKVSAEM